MLTNCLAACTHLSSIVSQLFEPQVQKIAVFTYRSPHFCFPWRRPCGYHAICCLDGKTIQCLPNPSQHVYIFLSIFNSFLVMRCLSQCVSPKSLFYHIFVSPGDAPGVITLNVVWIMDWKRIQCLQIVSQHVPIYLQQFPSYSNRKCKKSPFWRTVPFRHNTGVCRIDGQTDRRVSCHGIYALCILVAQ